MTAASSKLPPLVRRCLRCGQPSAVADLHSQPLAELRRPDASAAPSCFEVVRADLLSRVEPDARHLQLAVSLADSLRSLHPDSVTHAQLSRVRLRLLEWAPTSRRPLGFVLPGGTFERGPFAPVRQCNATAPERDAALRLAAEQLMLGKVLREVGAPQVDWFAQQCAGAMVTVTHPGLAQVAVPHFNTVRAWRDGARFGSVESREALARAVLLRAAEVLGPLEATVLWRHCGLSEGLVAHGR